MTFTPGQVLTAAEMNALEAATIPTGGITMYGAGSAPTGWLLCDGSAVSRTTYAGLFAVISDTYGVGNGTTTFNLPNLKGRVPVGRDSGDSSFDVLGETDGAKTHTLTTSEMPSHTHTQNSHNHSQDPHNHGQDPHTHVQNSHTHTQASHTHSHGHQHIVASYTVNVTPGSGATALATPAGSSTYALSGTTDTDPISTDGATPVINSATATNQATTATNYWVTAVNYPVTATNQNTGGGQAHNNLQPYLVLNFIIKT